MDDHDAESTARRESESESVDVVVIGAGISGVSAACRLVEAGCSVVVLERRGRVGGRLRSMEPLRGAGRLDVGASWCWPGEHRVRRLIDELEVATHPHHVDGDAVYHASTSDGRATSQRIDGNPIDVVSTRFTDGADGLVVALADRLPAGVLRLGDPATSIEATPTGLVVTARSSRIAADHVVLALPPALAVESIDIDELPDELRLLAASTPVWMGAIAKVVVEFDSPFWRESGLSGSAISHLGPMREVHDLSGPQHEPAGLFGFVPLRRGARPPTDGRIIDQLREIFGPDAPDPTRVTIVSWLDEAATSPSTTADLDDYRTYGDRRYTVPTVGGRLHWSSTETSTEAPGHIEGALAAAERAAAAILKQLRPASEPMRITP